MILRSTFRGSLKIFLSLFSAALLSACGGSGSSDSFTPAQVDGIGSQTDTPTPDETKQAADKNNTDQLNTSPTPKEQPSMPPVALEMEPGAITTPSPTPSQSMTPTPVQSSAPIVGQVMHIEAEQSLSDSATVQLVDGANALGYFDEGDWVEYSVDLKQGANRIQFRLADGVAGGEFAVRLGSLDGQTIATVRPKSTANWTSYTEQIIEIDLIQGEQSLFLVGTQDDSICNIDSITFSYDDQPIAKVDPDAGITAISLNVFGYKTMPQAAGDYARAIEQQDADVVGLQEGVQDWMLNGAAFPSDYSRSEALQAALGDCWDRRYQIFINTCKGNRFVDNHRWDLTDGDFNKATRTGETAFIQKGELEYVLINIHWEAFNGDSRAANVGETAVEANLYPSQPIITLGDFNSACNGGEVGSFINQSSSTMIVNAGIDCITARGFSGDGNTFNASPSDHPGVVARLQNN